MFPGNLGIGPRYSGRYLSKKFVNLMIKYKCMALNDHYMINNMPIDET